MDTRADYLIDFIRFTEHTTRFGWQNCLWSSETAEGRLDFRIQCSVLDSLRLVLGRDDKVIWKQEWRQDIAIVSFWKPGRNKNTTANSQHQKQSLTQVKLALTLEWRWARYSLAPTYSAFKNSPCCYLYCVPVPVDWANAGGDLCMSYFSWFVETERAFFCSVKLYLSFYVLPFYRPFHHAALSYRIVTTILNLYYFRMCNKYAAWMLVFLQMEKRNNSSFE